MIPQPDSQGYLGASVDDVVRRGGYSMVPQSAPVVAHLDRLRVKPVLGGY